MASRLNTDPERSHVTPATAERLAHALSSVTPPDPGAEARAWTRLDSLTKPPRSLGRLEEVAARVATIQETERPSVERKAILLMAGDHGV